MKYFNTNMTSGEARTVLFSIVDGMTPEEVQKVKDEYLEIIPEIHKRETEERLATPDVWLTADTL